MRRLSLAVLGAPELRHAGQALTLPNRKALALLIYLAVEGGRHSREKLAALLWPESDEVRARGALRLMLTYLRDALGVGHPQHVLIERDVIGFNRDADFDLDLNTLHAAAQIARTVTHTSDAAHWAALQSAVGVYRGDFLEGFSLRDAPDFDNWASLQREVCHRRMSLVLDRLSQWQSEGGELADAIETASRWIALDPLNEAAHRRLIQAHLATDDRAAALRAYETCRTILEHELNAEPSPDTEALADRIRKDDFRLEPETPQSTIYNLQSAIPLVGRASEHAALAAAFRAARRGRTHVAIIEGEPGIGKTRLGTEFLRWARAQGATVLQGRAFETSGGLSYQPVVDGLRSYLGGEAGSEREIAPALPQPLSQTWLAELSRLLPELRDRYPELPQPLNLDQAEARMRLFEAVARFGQAIAESMPLVVFIDDLQWADAASLDLLHYITQRWHAASVPALVLLTVRSDDLAARSGDASPLANWLLTLSREPMLTRLPLPPLTLEDTQRLADSLAPNMIETDQLFADSGGHPLFIVETIKAIREGGQHVSIPPGVRNLIRARLHRLSPDSFALCTAAAVLGSQFTFEALCQVADLSENTGLPALDELLTRGLLKESGARYMFTHDNIREIMYADAGAARRRVFHRRALEALLAASAAPGELARHALAADLADRAFEFSLSAGDEAFRLFAIRDAIDHYEQARALITDQLPISSLQALYAQLGRAYELNDDRERARAIYKEMLDVARERRGSHMECAALMRQAMLVAQDARDFERAQDLLCTALAVAEASADILDIAETEWALAQTAHYASDMEKCLRHGARALSLAREVGATELIARSLNVLAYAYDEMGRWVETLDYAREAQMLYAEIGNRAMVADSLSMTAEAQLRLGQPRVALESARAAHAISAEIENAWGQANSAQTIGLALLEIGEYGEALEAAQAGVAAARAAAFPPLVFFNLMILGNIYRALFALDAACAVHLEAQAIAGELQHPFMNEWLAAELCADCAVAGAWSEAYTYARQRLARGSAVHAYMGLTYWLETETLLRAGDRELAAVEVKRFGERLGGERRYRIPYLRALAVLTPASESIAQERHLREAAALAEEIGLPGELWPICAALGETDRAVTIVQSLAARIGEEQLRTRFLSAAPVRQVLEA